MDFSNPVVAAIGAAIVGSIIGPVIILIVTNLLGRNKNKGDYSLTLQEITDNLAKDLKEEKLASKERDEQSKKKMKEMEDRYQSEIQALSTRLAESERSKYGPFRVETEFVTHPTPLIIRQDIYLVDKDT